jgi:hypothetical protein
MINPLSPVSLPRLVNVAISPFYLPRLAGQRGLAKLWLIRLTYFWWGKAHAPAAYTEMVKRTGIRDEK